MARCKKQSFIKTIERQCRAFVAVTEGEGSPLLFGSAGPALGVLMSRDGGSPLPPPQPAWDHAGSRLCPRAKGDSRSSAVLQTDSTKVLVFQAVCSLCARQYASRKKYSPSSVLYAPFVQIAKLLSASKNLSVTTVYSQVCISGHL